MILQTAKIFTRGDILEEVIIKLKGDLCASAIRC